MLDLKKMWTCDGFLVDANDDSVPDGVRVNIIGVNDTCKPEGLIDFYARLGLETTALSIPFTKHYEGEKWELFLIYDTSLGDSVVCHTSESTMEIRGGHEVVVSGFLRWLAGSWPHVIPAEYSSKVIIGLEWNEQQFRLNFGAGDVSEWVNVLPLESTPTEVKSLNGLQNLWTVEGFYQGNRIDLNSKLNVNFTFEKGLTAKVLIAAADLAARIGLHSTGIQFPLTNKGQAELEFVVKVNNSSTSQVNWEGNTVYFNGGEEAVVNALTYFATAKRYEEGGTFALWELTANEKVQREEPMLYKKDWRDQGEKEDLLTFIATEKDAETVIVYISEPSDVRKEIADDIKVKLSATKVQVRSAFKPGYFWIEEEIMPLLIGRDISKINIICKKNHQGLELENRWIQELYPIDESLAKHLSITSDQIEFFLEDIDVQYQVKAYDQMGSCIMEHTLEVPTIEMDYIDGKNKVYPTTGLVQVFRNGQLDHQFHNPTDRERFWLFFLSEVLPEITRILPLEEEGRGKEVPFFSRLIFDIYMSEEERKLGIEEERISPLEALHEDIYFNVLDYFEHLGEKIVAKRWDAPGSVQPFLHVNKNGKPSARIELYGFTPVVKKEMETKALFFAPEGIEPISCSVQLNGDEDFLLLESDWRSISMPKWEENVSQLKRLNGVNIWLGGISYEGRPIPVLDVIKPIVEDYYSSHKLSLYKPTILIETGHHANEVSSSPAVREMVREIVEDGAEILDHINIVFIPRANPDGTYLHNRLAKDNPEWKHHAARYNSVGLEYANARYKNTIFGEAEVIPKAIHRWLPDVMIDGHGIPGHEWIQPFAGFNSPPRFPISYSIPIAFIYGITKELEKEQYPEHQSIQEYLISGITEKINEIEIIRRKNDYWRNRYYKYGTKWLPDTFPIEERGGMNFYRWDTKVNRSSNVYLSRYPEWCSADFITEAADETVYGKTLAGCVLAQKSFNLGVIEKMAKCKVSVNVTNEGQHIKYSRKRPLQKG